VSKKEKSVSSRAGHGLMEGNVYAKNRYKQANERIIQILKAMRNGDLETFGQIVEDEALTLHALMMASSPSFTLLEPNTIEMIKKIRAFRMDTKLPVFFTLDAGPNIHLLYPDNIVNDVKSFIMLDLKPLCESGLIIKDKVGKGPQKLK
jgi:diphosphomevalonate decarboxylase